MKLKNYTSGVSVDQTIARIERFLADYGATGIMKEYDGKGVVLAINFSIPVGKKNMAIRLPADVAAVSACMEKEVRRPHVGTITKIRAQAARTAWKLMLDWVEVQISLIEMGQAETLQVFLPYVWNGRTTYYQSLKDSGFKQLEYHGE